MWNYMCIFFKLQARGVSKRLSNKQPDKKRAALLTLPSAGRKAFRAVPLVSRTSNRANTPFHAEFLAFAHGSSSH